MSPDRELAGIDVVVVHETNGRKYFEALTELQRRGTIGSLTFVESSVLWKFGHSIVRERRPLHAALRQAWRNLGFLLTSWRLRGKVVVLGLPPWDVRFLLHARLRRWNHLIYHTSWPYWSGFQVPRPGGWAGGCLRRRWLEILQERNVDVVAVISAASDGLAKVLNGKVPTIIPHVVSEAFFEQRASYRKPFHLLFVGELLEHRGLRRLADMITALEGEPVVLDIVGDGQLRDVAATLALRTGGTWYRHLSDRSELARVMASCQLLVSPAVKTARWEELFGMAIIEAMACGVPCIVSNHVGPRSIIDDGISGVLLSETASSALVDWVRCFLRDEQSWSKMSAAARTRAETFRLSEIAARWERVLLSGAGEIDNRCSGR